MIAPRVGRMLAERIADSYGARINALVNDGIGLSGPVARAFVDALVVDRVVNAVWPSLALLAALLVLHAAGVAADSIELERIGVGLATLGLVGWGAYASITGAGAAAPHLRLWCVTRLSPVAHVRLLVFHAIRQVHRRTLRELHSTSGLLQRILTEALEVLQSRLQLTPDQAALRIADHLAPVVVQHLLARLAWLVLPVAVALLYFRLAIYPELVAGAAGGGGLGIMFYPFAAAADGLFGTALRSALLPGR